MSCLTYYGLSNLIFYEGKMNLSKYIEIHDANLPSIFNLVPASCCRRKLFQDHNAKTTCVDKNKSIHEEKSNKCIIMGY